MIYCIAFICSAISSGYIRSRLVIQEREASSQLTTDPAAGTPPTAVLVPHQPLDMDPQKGNLPNYDSVVTTANQSPASHPEAVNSHSTEVHAQLESSDYS